MNPSTTNRNEPDLNMGNLALSGVESDGSNDHESSELGRADFLSYRLLQDLQDSFPESVSRSRFLHLAFMTDHQLDRRFDVNSQLACYWYIFGGIIDENQLDPEIYHAPNSNHWNGRVYKPAPDVTLCDFSVSADFRDCLNTVLEDIVSNWGDASARELQDHLHSDVPPNEFISTLHELRQYLKSNNYDEQHTLGQFDPRLETHQDRIVTLLRDLDMAYPDQDYPEFEHYFRRWHDQISEYLYRKSDYRFLRDSVQNLIQALAKVEFRFHHRSNIPDQTIRKWEKERQAVKGEFERHLNQFETGAVSFPDTTGIAIGSDD